MRKLRVMTEFLKSVSSTSNEKRRLYIMLPKMNMEGVIREMIA